MSKPFLMGMEHECATRVPNKPLRPFGGTTLFDIYLKKFKALQDCELFSGQGIALWRGDERLCAKAEAAGVPIIERSEASAKGHGDYKVIFDFLNGIDAEWIVRVNCCAPFLKSSTIRAMAADPYLCDADAHRKHSFHGMTTVRMLHTWLWTCTGEPGNEHETTTQACKCFYESTHGVHVFRRKTMLEEGWCWDPHKLTFSGLYLLVSPYEWVDIDTPEGWMVAQRIAESLTEEEWQRLYHLPIP